MRAVRTTWRVVKIDFWTLSLGFLGRGLVLSNSNTYQIEDWFRDHTWRTPGCFSDCPYEGLRIHLVHLGLSGPFLSCPGSREARRPLLRSKPEVRYQAADSEYSRVSMQKVPPSGGGRPGSDNTALESRGRVWPQALACPGSGLRGCGGGPGRGAGRSRRGAGPGPGPRSSDADRLPGLTAEPRGPRVDMPGVVRLLALLLVPLLLGSAHGLHVSPQDPRAQMMNRGNAGGEAGWGCGHLGPPGAEVLGPRGTPGPARLPGKLRQWAGLPVAGGRGGARVLTSSSVAREFRSCRLCRREPLPYRCNRGLR